LGRRKHWFAEKTEQDEHSELDILRRATLHLLRTIPGSNAERQALIEEPECPDLDNPAEREPKEG